MATFNTAKNRDSIRARICACDQPSSHGKPGKNKQKEIELSVFGGYFQWRIQRKSE